MAPDLNSIEFNLQEKKEFFNSFASLYESEIPIGDIFKHISASSKNEKIKTLCTFISRHINQGKTLEETLPKCEKALGRAYCALIAAGERAGKLENILSDILSNIAKQQEIKSALINALIYPCFIITLAFIVFLFFQFFVIPSFKSVTDYDSSMNMTALFIKAVIKIFFIAALTAGGLFYLFKNQSAKKALRGYVSKLWIIRGILEDYYSANFFYTASLAYAAGISAYETVMLSASVIGLDEVRAKILKTAKMIENGTPVSRALNLAGVFSDFALSQTAAGEESGRLDKTLKTAAKDYEDKMDIKIKAMLKLLGPAVLIIAGIITAFIAAKGYSEYYKALFSMF